jgi:hypothetical protein
MIDRAMLISILRWAGTITGSVVLLFLFWMLIGHLVGDANGPHGMTFSNVRGVVAFICFPVCTIIGLAMAYKWELAGGLLVLLSIVGLFVLRPDLPAGFWLWGTPAVLHLGYWAISRRR